jgi:hypothetical protein
MESCGAQVRMSQAMGFEVLSRGGCPNRWHVRLS